MCMLQQQFVYIDVKLHFNDDAQYAKRSAAQCKRVLVTARNFAHSKKRGK